MIPAKELETRFDEAFPYLFQKDLVQLVNRCYGEARTARDAHGFCDPIARWHLPYFRRSLIESQAAELAARFSTLQPEFCRTRGIRANPYLTIKSGPFILTESKVDERGQLPRIADFRTENSAVNYSLFDNGSDASAPIYVILTHLPHPSEACPESMSFVFPDSQYEEIVHSIDLLARFFAHIQQPSADKTSTLNPQPKLRKRGGKTGEANA